MQPTTQVSLILRLRNRSDAAAWADFCRLYRPAILRVARQRGLQPADAEDVAQQVLASVARAIDRWQPDPKRGRFSTWLHRIVHHALLNRLARRKPDVGSGDSRIQEMLAEQQAPLGAESTLLQLEFRRQVFQWAAGQVRTEFHRETWDAFWRTAVDGQSIEATAAATGRSVGAIYAARSRVMRRLREQVAEYLDSADATDDVVTDDVAGTELAVAPSGQARGGEA